MLFKKFLPAVCALATISAAQTINIQGIVKDNNDAGIAGATVKLEMANITDTTGADGSFVLTGNQTGTIGNSYLHSAVLNAIRLKRGQIEICLSENTLVAISVYDLKGRLLFRSAEDFVAGTHLIHDYENSAGLNLYKITIGQNVYIFKRSQLLPFSDKSTVVSDGLEGGLLSKQAKADAAFKDVILVTKGGQINYRDSIKTPDTSGIVIKMIPNAGNVTDVDGNVYQSVRIGNQVWTVENLKTTKFKDGVEMTNITANSHWVTITRGIYCYLDNKAENRDKYGLIYNGYAVKTGKLAPDGWHVPTDAEWDTLQIYLSANGYNWWGTETDNRIAKSLSAKIGWPSNSDVGTPGWRPERNNRTGFSALQGGMRSYDGRFWWRADYDGYWWSATFYENPNPYRYNINMAKFRRLCSVGLGLYGDGLEAIEGCYVRLLRD